MAWFQLGHPQHMPSHGQAHLINGEVIVSHEEYNY